MARSDGGGAEKFAWQIQARSGGFPTASGVLHIVHRDLHRLRRNFSRRKAVTVIDITARTPFMPRIFCQPPGKSGEKSTRLFHSRVIEPVERGAATCRSRLPKVSFGRRKTTRPRSGRVEKPVDNRVLAQNRTMRGSPVMVQKLATQSLRERTSNLPSSSLYIRRRPGHCSSMAALASRRVSRVTTAVRRSHW